jgi:DNA-binding NarL/FixJ family response regulator
MEKIERTRILIVDDHEGFRDGVKTLINREADMEVVGEAENGQKAITLAGSLQPDLILMDVSMPIMDGIEATRRIIAKMPGMKILALSMYADVVSNSGMMRAGAQGYLVKGDDFDKLANTIRSVARSKKTLTKKSTK